ncbi:hypothetical protein JZ751_003183 [Albula glossodonta]|uniref:cyclic pyranopterin monophosphate synthase n=1 Tax=Albula glossodonta TaxID=121402 RepID=A0A8T2N901_9TELE|nr:hypothetical protein JZ751_003183 [Albula glossodonta]
MRASLSGAERARAKPEGEESSRPCSGGMGDAFWETLPLGISSGGPQTARGAPAGQESLMRVPIYFLNSLRGTESLPGPSLAAASKSTERLAGTDALLLVNALPLSLCPAAGLGLAVGGATPSPLPKPRPPVRCLRGSEAAAVNPFFHLTDPAFLTTPTSLRLYHSICRGGQDSVAAEFLLDTGAQHTHNSDTPPDSGTLLWPWMADRCHAFISQTADPPPQWEVLRETSRGELWDYFGLRTAPPQTFKAKSESRTNGLSPMGNLRNGADLKIGMPAWGGAGPSIRTLLTNAKDRPLLVCAMRCIHGQASDPPPDGTMEATAQQPRPQASNPSGSVTSQDTADQLTHTDAQGRATMVDVGGKPMTRRTAVAQATVRLPPKAFRLVRENQLAKGDALSVAQIAGIMAAKQTSTLIPLCHPLPLDKVAVTLELVESRQVAVVTATCQTTGRTGVEMEALTAASLAALTLYDMCKAVSHDITITDIRLQPPNPTITAPNPSISSPNPSISPPNPSISPPNPSISALNPSISPPNPSISSPNPSISALNPSISPPNPSISPPNPSISSPNPSISALNPSISPPTPPFQPLSPQSHPLTLPSQPLTPQSQPLTPPSQPLTPPSQPLNPQSLYLTPPSHPLTPPSHPLTHPSQPLTNTCHPTLNLQTVQKPCLALLSSPPKSCFHCRERGNLPLAIYMMRVHRPDNEPDQSPTRIGLFWAWDDHAAPSPTLARNLIHLSALKHPRRKPETRQKCQCSRNLCPGYG